MIGLPATLLALVASTLVSPARGQISSSWPQAYPGMPEDNYSAAWQSYFEVKESLPNVTWNLGRSFAGNIGVQRAGHPNDTLFFWGFEKESGSLTATAGDRSDEPWGIWLNGGPGAASTLGLLYENGPIHLSPNYSVYENVYGWNRLADYFWIDQPVGTGWSTADDTGFVYDEDQVGTDFMGFLENLVQVFPSLKTRPLYLTGESYAGMYIVSLPSPTVKLSFRWSNRKPYITKAYFGLSDPPVNLVKIAIGDGTVGSAVVYEYLPTTTTIQTYPQLIGYDPEVFEWFREQEHLCGYDLNFTYPQDGHFSDLQLIYPTDPGRAAEVYLNMKSRKSITSKRELMIEGRRRYGKSSILARDRANNVRREIAKRDLIGRANGTIDPWYGCFLYDAMIEYALNFTYPWNYYGGFEDGSIVGFDVYDVPDALNPEIPLDGSYFYNDPQTVAALHAPTSKQWVGEMEYPFLGGEDYEDPSVEPMAFLTELATNASERGVSVVLYSGNDDSLIAHRSTQVVIQNTTFGGIQGFTVPPGTPWYGDDGSFAGIVHQERNWTYLLFKGAGHLVSEDQPANAYVFLREFILGDNQTGFVETTRGHSEVVGGQVSLLAAAVLPGQPGIYIGSGATQSTYTFPTATIAAWEDYIVTATATGDVAKARSASGARPTARMKFP
ncbi:alpha/beta-hydrolase [Laetiporus sulphureus 93-53]|uniref:Carboxypeptidase n=1 Tax=Laetiporus sulphureus 93-53 TaxID=1314785 RepID=A0A165EKN7_9APHY|nr:alpha/beta-hydrolase [Laetiporus sulphureus 93-53]KZT07258.1 alpha/beta-hydrolase [Laetiporus sulphureus 93-53]